MKKRQGIYLKEEAGFVPKIETPKKKKDLGEDKDGKRKKKKS